MAQIKFPYLSCVFIVHSGVIGGDLEVIFISESVSFGNELKETL